MQIELTDDELVRLQEILLRESARLMKEADLALAINRRPAGELRLDVGHDLVQLNRLRALLLKVDIPSEAEKVLNHAIRISTALALALEDARTETPPA